jgi:hypothetical protein
MDSSSFLGTMYKRQKCVVTICLLYLNIFVDKTKSQCRWQNSIYLQIIIVRTNKSNLT